MKQLLSQNEALSLRNFRIRRLLKSSWFLVHSNRLIGERVHPRWKKEHRESPFHHPSFVLRGRPDFGAEAASPGRCRCGMNNGFERGHAGYIRLNIHNILYTVRARESTNTVHLGMRARVPSARLQRSCILHAWLMRLQALTEPSRAEPRALFANRSPADRNA